MSSCKAGAIHDHWKIQRGKLLRHKIWRTAAPKPTQVPQHARTCRQALLQQPDQRRRGHVTQQVYGNGHEGRAQRPQLGRHAPHADGGDGRLGPQGAGVGRGGARWRGPRWERGKWEGRRQGCVKG